MVFTEDEAVMMRNDKKYNTINDTPSTTQDVGVKIAGFEHESGRAD
jgi:hypothetical protein